MATHIETLVERLDRAIRDCEQTAQSVEAANDAMFDLERTMGRIASAELSSPVAKLLRDQIKQHIDNYKATWFDTSQLDHTLRMLKKELGKQGE